MPTVAIVDGVKIQFFFNDHPPRHFHIEYAGQRAMVRLGDLQLLVWRFSGRQVGKREGMGAGAPSGAGAMLGSGVKQREPWEGRVTLGQRIVAVRTPRYPVAVLSFEDGREAEFDFGWMIDGGPAFAPLKDPAVFAGAHPGSGGASLEWTTPEGDEIDLSADALRMEAEGIWNPRTKQWTV